MIKLKDLNQHLKNLTAADWEKLFNFIHATKTEDTAYDFTDVMYELKLVVNFDWPAWTEGQKIAATGNYENLDRITLLKILSAIIRNDRFSEGALLNAFKNGTIEKILIQLKEKILCI